MIGWWRRIRGRADNRVVRHCTGGCGRRAYYHPDFRMVRYRCGRCRRRTRANRKAESTDALTGLANRRALEVDVQRAIIDTRTGSGLVGVLLIDLDGFKALNDRLGHAAGDALLKQVAERLPHSIKARDTAGRLAGDAFLVVLHDIRDRESTAIVARRIAEWITQPMVIAGETLHLTVSIGRAVHPDDGNNVETLIHNADAAMYEGEAAAAAHRQAVAGRGEQ